MIYLDSAATTHISQSVLDKMMPFLSYSFGNPGAIYQLGRDAACAVEMARKQVAAFINAEPKQIIFTSGGSESNALVFKGLERHMSDSDKKDIVVSVIEHDSVIKSAMHTSDILRSKFMIADPKAISNLDMKSVGIVSVMYANNETGEVTKNIDKIIERAHSNNALVHTDCVHAAGYENIDVKKLGCDFLSLSSHKIHGPKGVGALYVKDPKLLSPVIPGGVNQEFGLRGGTENVAGIVGFGEACEETMTNIASIREQIDLCKARFRNVLCESLSKTAIKRMTINSNSGKIINLRFYGIDAQTLLLYLDSKEIYASAGSACHGHNSEPSRVLMAYGLSEEQARESIRFSFSRYSTVNECVIAASIIADYVNAIYCQQI